ncbi:hypothetical protein RCC89_19580 [Cytophagaceae bacterium ABcell3]|nr:hypothetical protein RCC89_19580 [Cytophagaceae bacterium ABcell3]
MLTVKYDSLIKASLVELGDLKEKSRYYIKLLDNYSFNKGGLLPEDKNNLEEALRFLNREKEKVAFCFFINIIFSTAFFTY